MTAKKLSSASAHKRVCLGAFAGAHGVKGEAKVKTFTSAPQNIAAYGPVESEDGSRKFALKVIRILKDDLALVTAPEIVSREDAAALAGTRLYISRARLPATNGDEFYLEDLVGLSATDESNAPLGKVIGIHNFGAGDLVELKGAAGPSVLVPFTKEAIIAVEPLKGRMVIARAALELADEPDPSP